VFTARYALCPYIKQIRFFFKGWIKHGAVSPRFTSVDPHCDCRAYVSRITFRVTSRRAECYNISVIGYPYFCLSNRHMFASFSLVSCLYAVYFYLFFFFLLLTYYGAGWLSRYSDWATVWTIRSSNLAGLRYFSVLQKVQTASGAHPACIHWSLRGFFPGGKAVRAWSSLFMPTQCVTWE
jgi:hypothetical protein